MRIEIVSPSFKCESDENIFFGRLQRLKGVEGIVGEGRHLYLTLNSEFQDEAVSELQAMCDFWNTSYQVVER